ncbi:3-hydroxyacyl-CoA dehydrogenase [Paenibacillus swuensis]|uniref:3-hydroxyacyl-CoA dehydrogenase n=1 Tax=Paenibacillus swuensis TaxID=1178515 RepID=A0A172TLV3_9BACL|nr:3-hydroxyacyl-CoA dehydrogenase/enoyl-CoA hydratase family protein [Paenibacillus swuensis]ANE47763.1 3-hydroxyacyl-CoA dehydrogenase [Paenibacillus swuensis]
MSRMIRKAAVIGSGVMGSGIAAHLANVGIETLLLDIVPNALTPQEEAAGLNLNAPKVRNRYALSALEKLKKTNPSPLYSSEFAGRIQPGNLEDDLNRLSEADWIIEVIVENLEAKQSLYQRIEQVWKPGTIVSSNTSGISIKAMVQDRSDAFKEHFLGTHFFNPPRYMKLLEIIPGEKTSPAILEFMKSFCEQKLGKGVVTAKDTPNFIANRIGTFGLLVTLQEMQRGGFTVEEVDAVSGPAMGRPKSATFRTLDLVGLDTFVHVAQNVYDTVPDGSAEKEIFKVPQVLKQMVAKGWTGEKTGQGFFKKLKSAEGTEIQSLNFDTLEYAKARKITSASLEASKNAKGTKDKLKALLSTPDKYSKLAWDILKQVLIYSADKMGEIADTVVDIDQAMKWGFNWNLGPFETWDAIGLKRSVAKMEEEGLTVPAWVKEWIAQGHESFYQWNEQEGKIFYYLKNEYKALEEKPELISLAAFKKQNKIVKSNAGANLIDIGDGVVCLEFASPNNAIGGDILTMIQQSVDEVNRNWRGMVLANEGRNFCVGANLMLLLMEAQDEEWDEVNNIIRLFQDSMMKLRFAEKPVVAAPHKMTLGGGVEASLPADEIIFSAETYFGLVETGVGLIPAGGGCKEMVMRLALSTDDLEIDLQPSLNKIFETIAMGKVSASGHDTKRLGYMRPQDRVVINEDHRIYEAKRAVLRLADDAGYQPAKPQRFRVAGDTGKAVLQLGAYGLRQGGFISDHDLLIAGKLAHVLAGGNVPVGTVVTEQYMLDLEREAFLSLCGEPKTQARMQHMLTKGKPLRN